MTLDAADLAYMRQTQTEHCQDTAAVYDYARLQGHQGATETWVVRGAMVPCRIASLTPTEARVFAEHLTDGTNAMMTLPYSTPLKNRDQAVPLSSGDRWEVVAFAHDSTQQTAVRALVVLV